MKAYASAPRGQLQYLLFALVTLAATAPSVRADEVPVLRQGLWEYKRTVGAQKFVATECIDPSEDLRQQHAAQAKIGCKLAPVRREGATYTYTADCAIRLPSGLVRFSTTSVLTAASDAAYRIDSRTTNQSETTSESITAQRVADCTN